MTYQRDLTACPSCGSKRFALADEHLGQCFAERCGLRWLAVNDPVAKVMEDIYRQCHRALTSEGPEAALAHSMVGVIPADLSVVDLWAPHQADARQRLTAAETALQGGRGRPTNAALAAVAEARQNLNKVTQLVSDCEVAFKDATGARVWFWTAKDHRIVKMTVAPDSGEERTVGAGGLFNHGLRGAGTPARGTEKLRGSLLAVHRPEDVLAIQAAGAKCAQLEGLPPERGYVWCAAVGDSGGASTVRKLTRTPLLLMPDSPVGNAITSAVRELANLEVFQPPIDGGVADWLQGQEAPWDALEQGFVTRQLLARPFENVRDDIDALRAMEGPGTKKFQVDRWCGESIERDLSERGKLYFDGQMGYVFLHATHEVIPIDLDDEAWTRLVNQYGVAATDTLAKPVSVSLTMAAREHGTKAQVYPLAHYDQVQQAVYLFNLDKAVYRITANNIEAVENGTDGKLFVRNPKWEPFALELDTPAEQLPNVVERLLGAIHLRPGNLEREEVVRLFYLLVLAMFFPELFPTRPILAIIGPRGSGKTSSLELLGTLLFGSAFKVAELTDDARDFDAALTSEFFVVADNADRSIKWLADKLAVVATGGTIKRRMYYTTNKQVEFPLKAWLAITSRTPHFRREDVADRLLPIHVERFSGFTAQNDLKSDVVRDRNWLLTAVARDVQKALRGLRQYAGVRIETAFRMADYGQFAVKVSGALGFGGDVEDVLGRLASEQQAFAMRNEPLFEWLNRWLALPGKAGLELTTGELYNQLRQSADDGSSYFPWNTPQEFGQKLDDYRSTLETFYHMTERPGRSGTKVIQLHPAPDLDTVAPDEESAELKAAA